MPTPHTNPNTDWLSLVEISGPFVSVPVLKEIFPQGMEDVPAELARSLRADYEFWQENQDDRAVHLGWVRLVLDSLLGYSDELLLSGQAVPAGLKAAFPEHDETLRPDFVLAEPADGGERKPKLLIQVFPAAQDLGKSVTGSRWAASAATRTMELLHATEIRLGLVTNGEQWMLVDAPRGETTGFTTWYASLWFDERVTLNAFHSLLGVKRFFGVAEEETLAALLERSAGFQQEITDQLGLQVRHAVEILIRAVDKAEQNAGTRGGAPISPSLLYEAALTVMMRLVFLLSAEERNLLPVDDDQYSAYYAVSTLREQLQALASQHGEEVLERRYDAWSRLLAVFRAVHGGIHHQDLHLPAYGGSLFNPDKYPFLEGRLLTLNPSSHGRGEQNERPLAIDNRTVLHLLDALQMLRVDGEMRRLSFRALDVEQIGHVYEGLLDHKAVRADEVMLGLVGAKRLEPEIALSKLEQAWAAGEASVLALLKEETQKSDSALRNALARDIQNDASLMGRLRGACAHEDLLLARILPFAGLVRMDDFDNPVVILPGSVYVTAGTTRRATGTHYTPRSLTEPVVLHTLEPLVYAGVAEGLPREQWALRTPSELLALKVCDMAMGSGGFLVQVVRYLAERLVESWAADDARQTMDDEMRSVVGSLSTEEDALNYARRLVAERCIYGVDKNPLAVEIAKLSVWLVTLAKERPFTFLDHALKCGDSLVGAGKEDLLRWVHVVQDSTMSLWKGDVEQYLALAVEKRRELEGFLVRDVRDAERKQALLKEADAAMENVKRGADLLTGARLLGLKGADLESLIESMVAPYAGGHLFGEIDPDKYPNAHGALAAAQKDRVFHWEFEFPEVFAIEGSGGFSAFVGNPPFVGGKRISLMFGLTYQAALKGQFEKAKGAADYSAYFFRRACELTKSKGRVSLIATNSIKEADTREVGLDYLLTHGVSIYRADTEMPWPGSAAVRVSIIYLAKNKLAEEKCNLDDNIVDAISSLLIAENNLQQPLKLKKYSGEYSEGIKVYGDGFVISKEEAQALVKKEARNSEVISTYLNGDDLNNSFDFNFESYVINFHNWELDISSSYIEPFKIVKEKVKPQRDALKGSQIHETRFWLFWDKREKFYRKIAHLQKVLVTSITTKYLNFSFVPADWVHSHAVKVFAFEDYGYFAILQSTFHSIWARKYSSTLGDTLRYSTSDAFDTFAFPASLDRLNDIGEKYYEHRRQFMLSWQEGLTATYNRFHNPEEHAKDIVRLRELHVEMDTRVASAYGWDDLELGHDFHETAQGIRFTISESARREVLSRLLKLNHERYEEEQKEQADEGMLGVKPAKKSKGRKSKGKSTDGQMGLL